MATTIMEHSAIMVSNNHSTNMVIGRGIPSFAFPGHFAGTNAFQ